MADTICASAERLVSLIRERLEISTSAEATNLFVVHRPGHYETIAKVGTAGTAVPMYAVTDVPEIAVVTVDDDEAVCKPPLCLPSWEMPTIDEFRAKIDKMDHVQLIRHGVKILWYAKLHRLVVDGQVERARNLTSELLLDAIMTPDVRPPPGGGLPPKLWANNCTQHTQNVVLCARPRRCSSVFVRLFLLRCLWDGRRVDPQPYLCVEHRFAWMAAQLRGEDEAPTALRCCNASMHRAERAVVRVA